MENSKPAGPPWGNWMVLYEGDTYKVKRIEVSPGKRLSYQRHSRRMECWRVVGGAGKVTIDGNEIPVGEWDNIEIPVESAHRIENTGNAPLVFIEVQRGDYLGEDDIVRIEDDYGRAG